MIFAKGPFAGILSLAGVYLVAGGVLGAQIPASTLPSSKPQPTAESSPKISRISHDGLVIEFSSLPVTDPNGGSTIEVRVKSEGKASLYQADRPLLGLSLKVTKNGKEVA